MKGKGRESEILKMKKIKMEMIVREKNINKYLRSAGHHGPEGLRTCIHWEG